MGDSFQWEQDYDLDDLRDDIQRDLYDIEAEITAEHGSAVYVTVKTPLHEGLGFVFPPWLPREEMVQRIQTVMGGMPAKKEDTKWSVEAQGGSPLADMFDRMVVDD